MNPRLARLGSILLFAVAVAGWVIFAYVSVFAITTGWHLTSGGVRQVDWHVYALGARDLLHRSLYAGPLVTGGLVVSTPIYNLPPLSAVWPIPLVPLSMDTGGSVWQFVAASGVAAAAILAAATVGVPRPALLAGLVLGPLSLTLLYLEGLHLGTDNYLVVALVALFAWLALRGRERMAGLVLGLAIATKIWPVVLLVPMARERRWIVLSWAIGTVVVQAIAFVIWLGPDAVPRFLTALGTSIPATGLLIGPSAVEWLRPIWFPWVGLAVAAALLALPTTGRTAIGLAIIAGLAPITNLWIHYAPTVLLAVALIVAGLVRGGASQPLPRLRSALAVRR